MITQTKSGFYKVRFRVNPKLVPFFNRTEINKTLDTKVYAVANAKADIIHHKYKEILKVSRVLENHQIQELVDKYITESLEQDLIDRANCGQGTVFCPTDPDDEYNRFPSFASAEMCSYLKSDYLEELAGGNYSLIESTLDELLEKNFIQIDKESDSYRLLSYYMMLAQIEILEEAYQRGNLKLPNPPEKITKKLFGEKLPKVNVTQSVPQQNKKVISLNDALVKYIKYYTQEANSKGTGVDQINEVTTFLNEVFLEMIDKSIDIRELTLEDIMDFKDTLSMFPTRKIRPYNNMSTQEIVNAVYEESIPEEVSRIGKSTVNKYLGYTKAFFEYSRNTGLITVNPMALITTSRGGLNAMDERLPLDSDEINKLLELLNDKPNIQNAVKALYTSGMRLSELYKYKLSKIDGIDVYDLRDKEIKLKTKPSYRVIPVHSCVDIELLKEIPTQQTLSRTINNIIREHISEDQRKVLYSLRHSLATDLKNNKVEPTVISELMGHSHQTMTLQRYASGYDVKILKEAVETLSC